jgi:hypothetical protein
VFALLGADLERIDSMDAYSAYLTKGIALATYTPKEPPDPRRIAGLPRELVDRIIAPLVKSAWIPEIEFIAVSLAYADLHGVSPTGLHDWSREKCRKVVGGLLWRAMGLFLSPEHILVTGHKRWNLCHQGSTLVMRSIDGMDLTCELIGPRKLFGGPAADLLGGILASFGEVAQKGEVRVQALEANDKITFRATWRLK